jgi:hypothetical protein
MQLVEFIKFALPTFGISIVTAAWLARALINHRLTAHLDAQKADFDAKLTVLKAQWEGSVKQRVDTYLADRAADREYQQEARRRLYLAIGPLRFQLLMACRDLCGRVISYGKQSYDTALTTYYGRSFLFRILRPLTIVELIERQIAYADFSVEASALDLLRFKKAAYAALTGDSLVVGHPGVNWDDEEQHVFFDHLARAAGSLVTADGQSGSRCMRFDEFGTLLDDLSRRVALEPFPQLLADFTSIRKPLLWLRLVGLASLCNDHINRAGKDIGFEQRALPSAELLRVSADPEIIGNIDVYVQRCAKLSASSL